MKIYGSRHNVDVFSSRILNQYFKGMRIGVFDIETLGLNPSKVEVILAGLMSVDDDGHCMIRQYFAEKPSEEKELLLALQKDLNQFDYLLTYNGKHFDLPFIKKRAEILGLADYLLRPHNLDLYLYLQGHSQIRNVISSLKQKSVEEYMGLAPSRSDEISGKESVELYYDFLNSFSEDERNRLRTKILLHNHDDILQLYKIFPVILQTDIHKGASALGFPVCGRNGWPQLNVASVKMNAAELLFSGVYASDPFQFSSYSCQVQPFDCHFDKDHTFAFALPVEKLKDNLFFNLKRYFRNLTPFENLPGYVNGFLILKQKNTPEYLECNMLVLHLLEKFMDDVSLFRQKPKA